MDEHILLFSEDEIQRILVQSSAEDILKIYRNLAECWFWDGLRIKAIVLTENDPLRHLLVQAEDSPLYNPSDSIAPYVLGYLEIAPSKRNSKKQNFVRAVCSWAPVRTFWVELVRILQPEEISKLITILHPDWPVSPTIKTDNKIQKTPTKPPASPVRRQKWERVWFLVQGQYEKGDPLPSIAKWVERHHPNLPHSRLVISKIVHAGLEGLLDKKHSKI